MFLFLLVVPEVSHFSNSWHRYLEKVIPDLRSSNIICLTAMQVKLELSDEQRLYLQTVIDSYFDTIGSSLGCMILVVYEIYTNTCPIKQRYFTASLHV